MIDDTTTAPDPTADGRTITHERTIERLVPVDSDRRRWVGPFFAGVITTAIAFAVGIGVFLLVSDADDDGNIDLDVPAVDINVDN